MTNPRPCALAYGGNWPDGTVHQCARCLAKRHFQRGRSIVASVQCDASVARIPLPADDLESWRRLGTREKIARQEEEDAAAREVPITSD